MSETLWAKDAYLKSQQANSFFTAQLPKIYEVIRKAAERGNFYIKIRREGIEEGLSRSDRLVIETGLRSELQGKGYKILDAESWEYNEILFTVSWRDL